MNIGDDGRVLKFVLRRVRGAVIVKVRIALKYNKGMVEDL